MFLPWFQNKVLKYKIKISIVKADEFVFRRYGSSKLWALQTPMPMPKCKPPKGLFQYDEIAPGCKLESGTFKSYQRDIEDL
jgi:hypothetical protein